MEFYVHSYGDTTILSNLVAEEEQIEDMLTHAIYGCALVIATVIQNNVAGDRDKQGKLAEASVRMLRDVINKQLGSKEEKKS